ncbi:hypothetical protein WK16_21085 [Burkholderia ubonensis]|nr:hypothetical protein WK16_21085 [Burkholderia ubonensis]OJB23325.1 hypothetical protein BGV48_06695 [Burkholderia ubonensis]
MALGALPFVMRSDTDIRVSQTATTALRRRIMKTFQAVGMEKPGRQLAFGTSWTAMAVKNLARLSSPFMSRGTGEALARRLTEIGSLMTNDSAFTQQLLKVVLHAHLFTLKASDRASHRDSAYASNVMARCAAEFIVGLQPAPFLRQQRKPTLGGNLNQTRICNIGLATCTCRRSVLTHCLQNWAVT